MMLDTYESCGFFDELIGEDGRPRATAKPLVEDLERLPEGELVARQLAA